MRKWFVVALCLLVILSVIGSGYANRREVVITPLDTGSAVLAGDITETPRAPAVPATEEIPPAATDSTDAADTAETGVTEDTEERADTAETTASADPPNILRYVLNTNTKKFHYPDCASVGQMKEKNRADFSGTREEAIRMGYSPCGRCTP